jgi:hypothetical protein
MIEDDKNRFGMLLGVALVLFGGMVTTSAAESLGLLTSAQIEQAAAVIGGLVGLCAVIYGLAVFTHTFLEVRAG